MATILTIHHRGETREATPETWEAIMQDMLARLGPWDETTKVDQREEEAFSDFGPGRQVTDHQGADRVQAQQEAAKAAGIDASGHEWFPPGTRMARIGYENQARRKAEFDHQQPLAGVVADLTAAIHAEKRTEVIMAAADFGKRLQLDGRRLHLDGYRLGEQAVRGLLSRLDSPAASYVFGLRDRIADHSSTAPHLDAEILANVLTREAHQNPDVQLMLRMRQATGDIFAVVSPDYGIADAPVSLPVLLDELPQGARGSYSYDPTTTTWEVRAETWTPTPVDIQVVGEPFKAYTSYSGRDNGTRRLRGGGGLVLVICLNASIYDAADGVASLVHRRGTINPDAIRDLVREAAKAVHTMHQAWGLARETVVPVPTDTDGNLIPMAEALPGLWRGLFTERKGQLVGVLAGRREEHVAALTTVYQAERRNPSQLVKADFGQAWTRYTQGLDLANRRPAEAAIGAWLADPAALPTYVEA